MAFESKHVLERKKSFNLWKWHTPRRATANLLLSTLYEFAHGLSYLNHYKAE